MSTTAYLPILSAPLLGAIPCFRLPEFDLDALAQRESAAAEDCDVDLCTAIASSPAGAAVTPLQVLTPSLPLFGMRQARKPRMNWTPRCTDVLVANAAQCTNAELVELIEAETGLRFSLDTVNTRRCLLGLETPGRNEWTSPLRRWRPWQGAKPS